MKQNNLYFLIKPASSSCNLRCKYCFYANVTSLREIPNFGIMNETTMLNLINYAFEVTSDNAYITFAFQGGEPTLAGPNFFKRFIEEVNKRKVKHQIFYRIQTNSYKIDDEYFKIFKDNNFLVGVSLDGYKENNDYFRISVDKESCYKHILQTVKRLENMGIEYNIVSVLTKRLAEKPRKYYEFIKQNDFRHVQIIPCLPPLDDSENFGLDAKGYAKFHKTLFDLWYQDLMKGNYYSINTFDNYIHLLRGNPNTICGINGICSEQLIVESNGNIYPCDFYTLDELLLANINNMASMANLDYKKFNSYEEHRVKEHCKTCKFFKLCHGGCKRMSEVYHYGDYCGLEDFLDYALERMINVIRMM